MNRYSTAEVSAYHPMTTQEIWAPAAAMRQQHNEADKQSEETHEVRGYFRE